MTVKVAEPLKIDDTTLVSSDIAEPDLSIGEQEWIPYEQKRILKEVVLPSGYFSTESVGDEMLVYNDEFEEGVSWYYIARSGTGQSINFHVIAFDFDFNVIAIRPTEIFLSNPVISIPDRTKIHPVGFGLFNSLNNEPRWAIYYADRNDNNNWEYYKETFDNVPGSNSSLGVLFGSNFPADIKSFISGSYPFVNIGIVGLSNAGSRTVMMIYAQGQGYLLRLLSFDGAEVARKPINSLKQITTDGEKVFLSSVSGNEQTIKTGKVTLTLDIYDYALILESSVESEDIYESFDNYLLGAGYFPSKNIYNYVINDSGTTRVALVSADLKNLGAYQKGDEAITTDNHTVYRVVSDRTFVDPRTSSSGLATDEWVKIGSTNKWAMFDDKTSTPTVSATSFSVTFKSLAYINIVAFFEIYGVESVDIVVRDKDDNVVYSQNFALIDVSTIYDFYTYFFYQLTSLQELLIEEIPPYIDPEVTVTFNGQNISVGELVSGFSNEIGTCLSGTKSESLDYSTQTYDEFGNVEYQERPIVKLNTYEVLSDKSISPFIQRLAKNIRGKNTLWIADIGEEQRLITYGRFELSSIPFTMPNDIKYSITVRGSI